MKQKLNNFRPAHLVIPQNKKDRWCITFYAFDEDQQKLVRKRDYEINKIKGERERQEWAKLRISQINRLLAEGYTIKAEVKEKTDSRMLELLNYAVDAKSSNLRSNTNQSYQAAMRSFTRFLEDKRQENITMAALDKVLVYDYLDYLARRGVSAQSRKTHLFILKGLINLLIDREILDRNPITGVKTERQDKTMRNRAFDPADLELVKAELQRRRPTLYKLASFMYYTFIRPGELVQLRVKHLDLRNNRIIVPGPVAKSRKDGWVIIPEALRRLIMEWGMPQADPEDFLFGAKDCPSKQHTTARYMGNDHRRVLARLGFDNKYTLYSWKHTGVVAAYRAGIDIKSIQAQCRHASIQMTDIYLKSLGLIALPDIAERFPEL